MRKRTKVKRRSCGLCKPHKRGLDNRWTAKDEARLVVAEREMRMWLMNGQLWP